MTKVLALCQDETVRVDPDRLFDLYEQLGTRGADGVVGRAMEELAIRLGQIAARHSAADLEAVRKGARGLIAIADQIGMTMLARVAADVTACARDGDHVALAATVARLGRIGERSLIALWNLQDPAV